MNANHQTTMHQKMRANWNRLLDDNAARCKQAANAQAMSQLDWGIGKRAVGGLSADRLNHLARQCWNSVRPAPRPAEKSA